MHTLIGLQKIALVAIINGFIACFHVVGAIQKWAESVGEDPPEPDSLDLLAEFEASLQGLLVSELKLKALEMGSVSSC